MWTATAVEPSVGIPPTFIDQETGKTAGNHIARIAVGTVMEKTRFGKTSQRPFGSAAKAPNQRIDWMTLPALLQMYRQSFGQQGRRMIIPSRRKQMHQLMPNILLTVRVIANHDRVE